MSSFVHLYMYLYTDISIHVYMYVFFVCYHPTIILAANEHLAPSLHHPSENPSTENNTNNVTKMLVFTPPAEVG